MEVSGQPLPNHFSDELVLDHIRELATLLLPAQNECEEKSDGLKILSHNSIVSQGDRITSVNLGYELTCGLVMKLKNAIDRLSRRCRIRSIEKEMSPSSLLLPLCMRFAIDPHSSLTQHWDEKSILSAAEELISKSVAISADLKKLLNEQPLIRSYKQDSLVHFDNIQFLLQIKAYFDEVSRPEGTFEEASLLADETVIQLAKLPREICSHCNGRKQVYCGECCGKRLPLSSELLPARVELPFDILLVVHWHETLHKCTGVHAGALATEGSVGHANWAKDDLYDAPQNEGNKLSESEFAAESEPAQDTGVDTGIGSGTRTTIDASSSTEEANEFRRKFRRVNISKHKSAIVDGLVPVWGDVALGLCADTDVLLFPAADATDADDFDWTRTKFSSNSNSSSENINSNNNSESIGNPRKWRLIVLEASWLHAKSVYRKINFYREEHKLPPIPCVRLKDITGQYWKFHEQGHAAVSSIEAIAYAAKAAGATEDTFQTLLTLFRLQKYRVLKRIKDGGRPPKAIKISGSGTGSWDTILHDALGSL